MILSLFVPGIPAPQGSKKYVGNGISIESNKRTKPWRDTVTAAAIDAMEGRGPSSDKLTLLLDFRFPRLGSHLRKDGTVKANAELFKASAPDSDKLIRCICDALQAAGVVRNDAQFVEIIARKTFSDRPGVKIGIIPARDARRE